MSLSTDNLQHTTAALSALDSKKVTLVDLTSCNLFRVFSTIISFGMKFSFFLTGLSVEYKWLTRGYLDTFFGAAKDTQPARSVIDSETSRQEQKLFNITGLRVSRVLTS